MLTTLMALVADGSAAVTGTEHIVVAIVAAIPASIAAFAAVMAARRSKPVGNGWTNEVTKELNEQTETIGRIEGLIEAHVNDDRAHLPRRKRGIK